MIDRRKRRYLNIQKVLLKVKSFDQVFVLALAVIIGLTVGYLSIGFRILIDNLRELFWGAGTLLQVVMAAPIYMKLGIPAVIGMTVALFVNRFAREAKGHGVPEVMDAVATKNGFMRVRIVVVKAIASALSISSGMAVGREGPIIQIGSAFGSSIGQMFQVSRQRMNTFVGCGAAAGIAATFNAPVAGAIFASEIILTDFSLSALGPIIVASVFGTIVARSVLGDIPAFAPPVFELISPTEIIFYIALGLIIGLMAWAFVKTLYGSEDLFDKWRIPIALKACIGGLIIGGAAIYFPQVMGVGYDTMEAVFQGNITIMLAATLAILKVLATSISLGSGASGGVFAPSLFMGAMVGGSVGGLFHTWFPAITAHSGAYSLVGMAAMVAATTHAPITAIMIIFEMTGEYTIILPLMITSIIASMVTSKLLDGTIYTIKLKRRGTDIQSGTDVNLLAKLNVAGIKQQLVDVFEATLPLDEVLDRMSKRTRSTFYVVDHENKLLGIITQGIISRFINSVQEIPIDTTAQDICNRHIPKITNDTPVHAAFTYMTELDMYSLPVTDDAGKLRGQVRRSDIFREYQDMLIQSQLAGHMASQMKFSQRNSQERTEVLPGFLMARIEVPSQFLNQTVFSLDVRSKFGVEILIIRKRRNGQFQEVSPKLKTRMERGDQILIFGETTKVDAVCKLT
jgi:CIC family chloride channel protein